jgi:dTDP-4-amino-4,6-dideoxygalactose transaminase
MFQVELPLERLRGDRAVVMLRLRELGIGTGVHYPAIHLFTHYRALGWREGQFPHAERLGRALLTLPLFPQMRDDDPLRVCRALSRVLDELAI